MPVSLLNADTSFPSFTEGTSTSEKVDIMMNYLYMLLEELRYTFGNLGTENFNDKSLDELSVQLTKPVYGMIEDETAGLKHEIKATAEGLESLASSVTENAEALAQFKTFVSDSYATIQQLTQFKQTVADDTSKQVSDSLTQFEQTADATYAKISSLAAFKEEVIEEVNGTVEATVNTSLASFESKADGKYAAASMVAEYKTEVSKTYATKNSLSNLENSLNSSMASFTANADATYAKATQIASVTNSSGKVTAASIVTAVNNSGSSVKISADKVDISGFVTFSDLGDSGSATIAGNRISLLLDGSYDNGYDTHPSTNELKFTYVTQYGSMRPMASIYTKIDGSDSDVTSRYALCIDAYAFNNSNGTRVHAALKLFAAGRMSLESQYSMYIGNHNSGLYGSITIDADDVTCIRAYNSYSVATASGKGVGYCFCKDGIYYNGSKIVST